MEQYVSPAAVMLPENEIHTGAPGCKAGVPIRQYHHLKTVSNARMWEHFISLPHWLYRNDPLWVPPLQNEVRKHLDARRNPFFSFATAQYWLAYRGSQCVGRIAAIHNPHHNAQYGDRIGFFGYFECIDDPAVAASLLAEAARWLRDQGCDTLRGPVNLSTANESGLLVDGFDRAPMIEMAYNHSYYPRLLEDNGFSKAKDLLAYYLTDDVCANERAMQQLERHERLVHQRTKVQFRPFNLRNFGEEVRNVHYLFNTFMNENWGFVPITEAELLFAAQSLRQIIQPDLCFFAEADGQPVGVSLSVPDVNQVLKKLNGRLFPFGLFRYLYYRNRITDLRVMLLGVIKPYRKRGLEAVFYRKTIQSGRRLGFRGAELSWISEDNAVLIQELQRLGAKQYKTYRVYDKPL
jgi:GNAT superfamily N-acetyltransferase